MKHRFALFIVLALASLVLSLLAARGQTQKTFSTPTPTATPVAVDQLDRLEIQMAYDQVIKANQAFQNRLLQAQIKYGVKQGWNYNFDLAAFVPPAELNKPSVEVNKPPVQPSPEPKKEGKP